MYSTIMSLLSIRNNWSVSAYEAFKRGNKRNARAIARHRIRQPADIRTKDTIQKSSTGIESDIKWQWNLSAPPGSCSRLEWMLVIDLITKSQVRRQL